MNYLQEVLRSVIKESIQQDSIIDAIKKKYEVNMSYTPDEDGRGGGARIIQPVAYGTSKSGNPVVRAYQPYGDTTSKVPSWKEFLLDKIGDWKPMKNRKFKEPPLYNSNGDEGMSEVYINANFDNSKYEKSGLKKYNDAKHKENVDKDQYYDLKKNIKNSINGMQFDYIRKNIENWQNSKAAQEFKGNQSSIYDMQRTNSFDTGTSSETVGPLKKDSNENEVQTNSNEKPNYQQAKQNGPVYKDEEENYETPDIENNDNEEENNIENDEQRSI